MNYATQFYHDETIICFMLDLSRFSEEAVIAEALTQVSSQNIKDGQTFDLPDFPQYKVHVFCKRDGICRSVGVVIIPPSQLDEKKTQATERRRTFYIHSFSGQ